MEFCPHCGEDLSKKPKESPKVSAEEFIQIKGIIKRLANKHPKGVPIEDVVAEALEKNITEDILEKAVYSMLDAKELTEPKRGFVSIA